MLAHKNLCFSDIHFWRQKCKIYINNRTYINKKEKKGRVTEREGDTERALPSIGFLPKWLQQPLWAATTTLEPETPSGSSM